MAKFFINRPIVAMVISILMVIVGVVAMVQLPVALYPNIAPPEILLTARYPGADDSLFLANYAYVNINDPMTRVRGIGQVLIFGASQYAIRLWINPDTLAKLDITVNEIASALQAQNTVNPAGQLGGDPVPPGQELTYTVLAQGRLASLADFENVGRRARPDGALVRVKDVARVELGAQNYIRRGRLNGQ